MWGIWGSDYNVPEAIFYLLKGDYMGSSGSVDREAQNDEDLAPLLVSADIHA